MSETYSYYWVHFSFKFCRAQEYEKDVCMGTYGSPKAADLVNY